MATALGVGSVVGVIVVALILSLATLVYSGPAEAHLPSGSFLFLLGGAILNLVLARWSSVKGTVALPQDGTTAVMAVTIAAFLPQVSAAEQLGTVVVYILVATVVAGGVMLTLGALRLGDLIRFVPYPVIGGFLAGTGWLLVVETTDLVTSGFQWSGPRVVALAASFTFAVLLLVQLRRGAHPLTFPLMIVGGAVLFFVILAVGDTSIEAARSIGLLSSSSAPRAGLALESFAGVDWRSILSGWAGILTVPVVATLALLLNLTALELLAGVDADLNRELRTVGVANLLASITGSPAGYHALGASSLSLRLAAGSRGVPIVVAGLCLLAMAAGPTLIGLLPIPLVGGIVLLVGLSFLSDWLIYAKRHMTWTEYWLMVAIVVAVAVFGVLAGVVLGSLAAVALFAAAYSRIDPIRHVGTAQVRRSSLQRTPACEEILAERGDSVLVVELQGYLFFGTARTVVNRIRLLLEQSGQCRALILDLKRVPGIDSTSLVSFATLRRLTTEAGCLVILSDASPQLRRTFEQERLIDDLVQLAPDLDHALERAEDLLLESSPALDETLADIFGESLWAKLRPHLTAHQFAPGSIVVDYGDESTGLILVERGRVTAEIPAADGGWIRVRSTGLGSVLGEMSIYGDTGRSARIRAETLTSIYSLDEASIAALEQADPAGGIEFHRRLATVLAARLAISNETVRSLSR